MFKGTLNQFGGYGDDVNSHKAKVQKILFDERALYYKVNDDASGVKMEFKEGIWSSDRCQKCLFSIRSMKNLFQQAWLAFPFRGIG
jgi:hypothetical protein